MGGAAGTGGSGSGGGGLKTSFMLVVGGLIFFMILQLLRLPTLGVMCPTRESSESAIQKGVVNGLFYYQHLSSYAFHGPVKSMMLDRLLPEPKFHGDVSGREVAIVGIPNNEYVVEVASHGLPVKIVEPNRDKIRWMRDALQGASPQMASAVRVLRAAMGPRRGNTFVRSAEKAETVQMIPLDAVIGPKDSVYVLKLDTQGTEYNVLDSARHLMKRGAIKLIWVELTWPCQSAKATGLLEILAENYYLFDFAWWGQRHGDNTFFERMNTAKPARLGDFYFRMRPNTIDAYVQDMCSVQKKRFAWLQTDIVAIHHDYLNSTHIDALSRLSRDCDSHAGKTPHKQCWLSQLSHDFYH